jgi:hypothetical protein
MLIADDYDVCQDIAAEARVAGFDGIVGASAALTRETTGAIFGAAIPHRLSAGPSRVRRPPPRMWLLFRLIRLPAAIAPELGAFYAHLRRGRKRSRSAVLTPADTAPRS